MLPDEIKLKINKILTTHFNREVRISNYRAVSGGDINSAVKIETSRGNFFLKWNYSNKSPEMFSKEAKGLEILAGTGCIRIPKVINTGETANYSFLLLESIEEKKPQQNFWHELGKNLACLHKNTSQNFGLEHDNYIGTLHQSNTFHGKWTDFFREERIKPMMKSALLSKLLNSKDLDLAERLFDRLTEIFPESEPSLIHGDLWSGNFMTDEHGMPCLIDPAVYYGNREMDIAMSKLFGGFNPQFYEAYHYYYPLSSGWEKRLNICKLYPLLVHLNLFGGQYAEGVRSILRVF